MLGKDIFVKGLRPSSGIFEYRSPITAESSIYFWWWRFLRLSPVLWYANRTGLKPISADTAKVIKKGGDIFGENFFYWWVQNCENLFAEPLGRKVLTGLKLNELKDHSFDKNSLYVEVPLSIPINRVMKEFRSILTIHHQGRRLNLAATSQAAWPLHTMRYRLEVIEKSYWTLVYSLLYPSLSVWRIGDRLQYAPHLKVRGTEWSSNERRFNSLNSLSGRYLYKGRHTLQNVEHGCFPNLNRPENHHNEFPFGKRHQTDFLKLTAMDAKKRSPWLNWIAKNNEDDLTRIVYEKNFNYISAKPSADTTERFLEFFRGSTDQLP